jgi:hypothetical protein
MKFVLNRDRVIATTLGHTIAFKKGEPVEVPPILWAEMQKHGAIPEEDLPEEEETPVVDLSPEERKRKIKDTMESLVLKNSREDFTAAGAPHSKALERELGFRVDARERDVLWLEVQQKGDDKDDPDQPETLQE